MSFIVGPTSWWVRSKEAVDYYARACPVGSIMPDGSVVYCKAGGLAWIVSPPQTAVLNITWAQGQYNSICVGSTRQICCINEWPLLCTRLINCGFNPCDWFVPDITNLLNLSNCRVNFTCCVPGSTENRYWSSTELDCICACFVYIPIPAVSYAPKSNTYETVVRSIRCIPT